MPERINAYGLIALAGIIITAAMWGRFSRHGREGGGGHDLRLTLIYFIGLGGALIGAKIAFLLAEGWHYRGNWIALLSGRSITGGLLGGYLTARFAPRNPMRHVLVLGVIGLVLATAGAIVAIPMNLGPAWYPIVLALTALPCVWLGGVLHRRT